MVKKEAKARIKINKLLEEAGWRFFDTPNGKANITLETNVKLTEKKINELGENFEKTKNGYVDYLLNEEKGFPIVVLEAKSEDKNPLIGKEKARVYAKSLNVRFAILSNGNLHYFWDLESGNPYIITSFPSLESISHRKEYKPNPKLLINEEVKEDYIVLTQKPEYKGDPLWIDESIREKFVKDNDLKFLRKYQLNAIHALQDAAKEGKDRFLFEMATGTGKTLVSAGIIKLFLKTGNAKRVLFLVDRVELENQAQKNFIKWLKNDYKSVIYKENKDDWKHAEIVVSTVQSLLTNSKYKDLFSPTDFDLVISDEAHRSISGNSRAVFEYFLGYKLGLTATPKDYLKNIDRKKLNERDPRQLEMRRLRDTYETFGCQNKEPTFRYSLIQGVKDGFLVNPKVIDARTDITTDLLSEMGYSIVIENEDGEEEEKFFFHKDFEKKLFSEKTNKMFCEVFMKHAKRDPITGEIGKTIIFCVSKDHCIKITQILNELAEKIYPKKYNSDFAVQITSKISDAHQMTIQFSDLNNNLNGTTNFLEGYKSSKARVCVTVRMMTTGYDCQDLLNICLMRPIFSPTDFVQIKGRGTRKYLFKHKEKDEKDNWEEFEEDKKNFKMFDFFANCEYFEEKYNYDEILKLPKISTGLKKDEGWIVKESSTKYENQMYDPLKSMREMEVGIEGMKIDRKLFEKFEERVKSNKFIKDNFNMGNIEEAEEYIKNKFFDKPEEYLNLEKLRRAIKLDRRLTLKEVLQKIFGIIKSFKSKEELLDDEFEKFVAIYGKNPEIAKRIHIIKHFMKAYILNNEIREIMETKEYSKLATNPMFNQQDLKELDGPMYAIVDYIKDYISLNKFA